MILEKKLLDLTFVLVDFHFLLCQAWKADGELNDSLRAAEREVCFRPDLLSEVINRKILEEDCLTRGWVLTGYPFNVADFKYLDTLDTPPNRLNYNLFTNQYLGYITIP